MVRRDRGQVPVTQQKKASAKGQVPAIKPESQVEDNQEKA